MKNKTVIVLLAVCAFLLVVSVALLSITTANLRAQIDGIWEEMDGRINALEDQLDVLSGEYEDDFEETEADDEAYEESGASAEVIDPGTVLAEIDGEKWTYQQLLDDIMADSAELEGIYDLADQSTINDLVLQELHGRIEALVLDKMIADMGITSDEQAIKDAALAQYEEALEYYTEDFILNGEEEASAKAQAEEMLSLYGMDIQTIEETVRQEEIMNAITEQISLPLIAERTTEEALQKAHSSAAAEAKGRYEEEPGTLEFELYYFGAPVYYIPEGYKSVKHIFLEFDEATAEKATGLLAELREEATDDARALEINAQLDEMEAAFSDRLGEIQAALNAGEDFDSLIEKYGEDGGMQDEGIMETGYYVNKDSGFWDDDFVDAVEALKAGEVSGPIITGAGVHIIKCIDTISAGAVPFESVRDEILAEVEQSARDEAYEKVFAEWSDKMGIKLYDDVLKAPESDESDAEGDLEVDMVEVEG